MGQNYNELKVNGQGSTPFAQTYFHGTKSDLKVGDLIEVGFNSNYGQHPLLRDFIALDINKFLVCNAPRIKAG